MNRLLTLIRRELWEYKTGFITLPLVCTLILSLLLSVGFLRFAPPPSSSIAAITPLASTQPNGPIPGNPDHPNGGDLGQQFSAFNHLPMNELPIFSHIEALKSAVGFLGFSQWIIAVALNILLLIVTLNYAHRTLFDDRKNREILFWRSMPVTETENLAAKLLVIYGLAPLMLLAMSFLASLICWLAATGQGANDSYQAIHKLLGSFSIYKNTLLSLLALLPIITWTLLASAYAKKSPFLLSTFLPIGLIFIDRLVQWATGFNLYIRTAMGAYSDYLSQALQAINSGITPSYLTASVPIIILSATFTAAAIWLRNNRYEL